MTAGGGRFNDFPEILRINLPQLFLTLKWKKYSF